MLPAWAFLQRFGASSSLWCAGGGWRQNQLLPGEGCLYPIKPVATAQTPAGTSVPGREAAMPSSRWSPGHRGLELG